MCYTETLYKSSDGSFIIYDGGFSNSNTDGRKLNDVMTEQAPDPNNITIAAWVITHAHGDHHATFASEFTKYRSKVKVENVIFNPPSNTLNQNPDNEGSAWSAVISTIPAFRANHWARY